MDQDRHNSPRIDLFFPVRGREIPVDHGYQLFAALARELETPSNTWLHDSDLFGIHRIRGRYLGQGRLSVQPGTRLGIRLPAALIPSWLPLAGKHLLVGTDRIAVGIPVPYALTPASNLYSHLVTTRNGHDESRFDAEISRQLEALEINARVARGPRRTFRAKDKQVVAYTLWVSGLTEAGSIRLQEMGLGGRRKLGCGLFVPEE